MKTVVLCGAILVALCSLGHAAVSYFDGSEEAEAFSELRDVVGEGAVAGLRAKRSLFSLSKQFKRWQDPKFIRYLFDSNFPDTERQRVRDAFTIMDNELGECINFQEITTTPTDGVNDNDYIRITNTERPNGQGNGITPIFCDVNPGRFIGETGQRMSVVTRPDIENGSASGFLGCVTQVRMLMGLIYRILGFYPELSRGDRDSYVQIDAGNMSTAAADQGIYSQTFPSYLQATPVGPFDPSSITIDPPAFYSDPTVLPRKEVFRLRANVPGAFGGEANALLSRLDCLVINVLYKVRNGECSINNCRNE